MILLITKYTRSKEIIKTLKWKGLYNRDDNNKKEQNKVCENPYNKQ